MTTPPDYATRLDEALALDSAPLSAHEHLAVAALKARLDVAEKALWDLKLPSWVLFLAALSLSNIRAELSSSDPFRVRLRLILPPSLLPGV